MFRTSLIFTATAALACALTAPALAGNGKTSTSSSIAVASVNGTGFAATKTAPSMKLGDTVRFATTVQPIAGWEYPMVDLQCYQDVNGDGFVDMTLLGPDVVFTWLDKPLADFTLGGYSSIWTLRGGGPAWCLANLDAFGWKGGNESVRILATTGSMYVDG